jgi:hypothetical protein
MKEDKLAGHVACTRKMKYAYTTLKARNHLGGLGTEVYKFKIHRSFN